MTRSEFRAAYREARIQLRTFADTSGKYPLGQRRDAESKWQAAWGTWREPAYRACVDRLTPDGGRPWLSNGVLFAYRHGLARDGWMRWVREKLGRRRAA